MIDTLASARERLARDETADASIVGAAAHQSRDQAVVEREDLGADGILPRQPGKPKEHRAHCAGPQVA